MRLVSETHVQQCPTIKECKEHERIKIWNMDQAQVPWHITIEGRCCALPRTHALHACMGVMPLLPARRISVVHCKVTPSPKNCFWPWPAFALANACQAFHHAPFPPSASAWAVPHMYSHFSSSLSNLNENVALESMFPPR